MINTKEISISTDIQDLLIKALSEAFMKVIVDNKIGLCFMGGSRGLGYNCANSDADIYVYVDDKPGVDTNQKLLTTALDDMGFSYDRGKSSFNSHDACYVYNELDMDICIMNEKKEFNQRKAEIGKMKRMLSKNKKVFIMAEHMCQEINERVYAILKKMI